MKQTKLQLSVVVPVYNEADVLHDFHDSLMDQVRTAVGNSYEVIYCDDGSSDDSVAIATKLARADASVKVLKLSRNFGKEAALTAGISIARGQAVLTIDGDGQHPVEQVPAFVAAWHKGAQVVIGIRANDGHNSLIKRFGTQLFYKLFNKIVHQKIVPGSTDFRLIDAQVKEAFLQLQETQRMTRTLIDWLGFDPQYITFTTKERTTGKPGYSLIKLINLAVSSFVSLTLLPLYFFGYVGILIATLALLLGTSVFIEQIILSDPLNWNFTGTAMLGILIVFLVGIVLVSQGVLSLYISHIHLQSKQRPLFVIDHKNSVGIHNHDS